MSLMKGELNTMALNQFSPEMGIPVAAKMEASVTSNSKYPTLFSCHQNLVKIVLILLSGLSACSGRKRGILLFETFPLPWFLCQKGACPHVMLKLSCHLCVLSSTEGSP
jgi:hypothetical protein